jgi:hypothetical protein
MEMKKEQIILTRTFYCQKCADEKRPQAGNKFITIGSTHHSTQIQRAQKGGVFGYSPHLIFFIEMKKEKVTFAALCGMDECGVRIDKEENERGRFNIEYLSDGEEYTVSLVDWNHLVLSTDLGYKV